MMRAEWVSRPKGLGKIFLFHTYTGVFVFLSRRHRQRKSYHNIILTNSLSLRAQSGPSNYPLQFRK